MHIFVSESISTFVCVSSYEEEISTTSKPTNFSSGDYPVKVIKMEKSNLMNKRK